MVINILEKSSPFLYNHFFREYCRFIRDGRGKVQLSSWALSTDIRWQSYSHWRSTELIFERASDEYKFATISTWRKHLYVRFCWCRSISTAILAYRVIPVMLRFWTFCDKTNFYNQNLNAWNKLTKFSMKLGKMFASEVNGGKGFSVAQRQSPWPVSSSMSKLATSWESFWESTKHDFENFLSVFRFKVWVDCWLNTVY